MEQFPSLLGDVYGPVMRGPSSSHTAASVRIGQLARQMAKGEPAALLAQFHPGGSLARTYRTQGSDVGLAAGLLGMQADDARLMDALALAREADVDVRFEVTPFAAEHPNTYRLRVTSRGGEQTHFTALSVGGGAIRVTELEGRPLDLDGGFCETIVLLEDFPADREDFEREFQGRIVFTQGEGGVCLRLRTEKPFSEASLARMQELAGGRVIALLPVLPVLSQVAPSVPFTTMDEMLSRMPERKLWRCAVEYECVRTGLTPEEVFARMDSLLVVMERSIREGLEGTQYTDRILGSQSPRLLDAQWSARLIPDAMQLQIAAYIGAIMETKSAMGVFVAAPTAGSCGCLAGTLIAVARKLECPREQLWKAFLAAGMVGVLIARHATFAAEVAGCQAECGAGSAMAAAGLVELMDGTMFEAAEAASMALQNVLGLVCDPVAGGVEAPCLGRNIMCGVNAFSCANMALAGFDAVVPLDETIDAMLRVGNMLPCELRCTGLGGLSTTGTGKRIARERGGEGGIAGAAAE